MITKSKSLLVITLILNLITNSHQATDPCIQKACGNGTVCRKFNADGWPAAECFTYCKSDADCPFGQNCWTDYAVCQCTAKKDNIENTGCDSRYKACKWNSKTPNKCVRADSQFLEANGFRPFDNNNLCQGTISHAGDSCDSDSDCWTYSCYSGNCQCMYDSDCGNGHVCQGNLFFSNNCINAEECRVENSLCNSF